MTHLTETKSSKDPITLSLQRGVLGSISDVAAAAFLPYLKRNFDDLAPADCDNKALMISDHHVGMSQVKISKGSLSTYVPQGVCGLALTDGAWHFLACIFPCSNSSLLSAAVEKFLKLNEESRRENLHGLLFIGTNQDPITLYTVRQIIDKFKLAGICSKANVHWLERVGITEQGVFRRGNMLDVDPFDLRNEMLRPKPSIQD